MAKADIKYLIMDVDGTLTDGKIYMSNSGEAMKAFNVKDGCGIHDILIPAGMTPVIVTSRISDIVTKRCEELGISVIYQGVTDKVNAVNILANNVRMVSIAYIGDDINDLAAMNRVKEFGGIVACPADAVQSVREIADFVAPHGGGNGAVRDFIEWLIE